MFRKLVCVLILVLAGCASAPERPPTTVTATAAHIDLADSREVRSLLYAQHAEWKGVRYKMGGLSKRGIDCSGFVYLTYRGKFGINLPRSTELQAGIGHSVSQKHLRVGDLVFFKTGRKVRHVGIYLGKHKFLHASTSRGVMISNLDNVYWRKHYWKSIRVN